MIWHGTAGHFIGSARCCFRLHTEVGGYRISSVGCFHYASDVTGDPVREIGSGRLYETMVFRNGPDGEVGEWCELDSDVYNDEASAEAGHLAMVEKYAALDIAHELHAGGSNA